MCKISSSLISVEPWEVATTTTKATGNTQNIYQNGKVGIGDFSGNTPATALDIENGAINGAIKIVDGTQGEGKLLVSDSNGVGTWRTIAQTPVGSVTLGVTPGNANAAVLNGGGWAYTNYYLSVPPGNSLVFAGFSIMNPSGGPQGYATFLLSTSSTNSSAQTGIITTTPTLAGFTINGGSPATTSVGEVIFSVNNNTSEPVTVYVWGRVSGEGLNSGNTFQVNGSSSAAEAFIFVRQ